MQDFTIVEEPFSVAGQKYVVREASDEAVLRYRSSHLKDAKFEEGALVKVASVGRLEGILESESNLAGDCVFEVNGDGKPAEQPIGQKVRRFPNKVTAWLIDWVKKNSLINEKVPVEKLKEQRDALTKRIEELQQGADLPKNSQSAATE